MIKKILATILASALILSMVACSSSSDTEVDTSTDTSSTTQNTSEEEEPKEEVEEELEEEDGALVYEYSMELDYATEFSVDYYEGGYKMITVSNGDQFLTIPEGAEIPTDLDENVVTLQMPITNMMVATTPQMSLISAIGGLDRVTLTTYDVDSWYIDDVITAMEDGAITYVGSYKEPDYEIVTLTGPQLSIFSSMIDSVPEVEEKLNELSVPVLVDQSSYETEPLGRTEWMKLYGALFDMEDEAEATFNEQVAYVDSLEISETDEAETVAIFYITSSGDLYVRNAGDYIVSMAELAGGEYILSDLNPDETGTENIDFETFYASAKDADNIIYIWSMGGKPATIDELIEKNELLSDFKAVQEGNVWCTTADFFQISNTLGYMIKDMNTALVDDGEIDELTYLFRLK